MHHPPLMPKGDGKRMAGPDLTRGRRRLEITAKIVHNTDVSDYVQRRTPEERNMGQPDHVSGTMHPTEGRC